MDSAEKEKNVQIEDADSGDVQPTNEYGEHVNDKMTFTAFMAIIAIATQFISYINTLLMPSTILSYIIADLPYSPNYTWITIAWNVCASVSHIDARECDDFLCPACSISLYLHKHLRMRSCRGQFPRCLG